MTITTLDSKQVWQSDDGQITKYEITFTSDEHVGQTIRAFSFSKKVAEKGFIGAVEAYKKSNSRGILETLLKQPMRGSEPQTATTTDNSSSRPYVTAPAPKYGSNERTMYTSYAKDLVMKQLETSGFDKEKLITMAMAIGKAADILYQNAAMGAAIEQASQSSLPNNAPSEDSLPPPEW